MQDCIKVCSAKSVSHVDGKESTLGIDLITKVHLLSKRENPSIRWDWRAALFLMPCAAAQERTYHFIADNEVTKYEWIQVMKTLLMSLLELMRTCSMHDGPTHPARCPTQVISERIFDYMAARRAESDAEGNAEDTATNDEEQET